MHVERTFTVARPIGEVFTYLSDFTTTHDWDPGTLETTRISGDGGLGTTYSNLSKFMGRRVKLVYETVAYDLPREVKFRGVNGGTTATDWFRLSAREDSTEIHYRADFDFSPLLKLVAPLFIKGRLDRLADETIEQMKQAITA